MTSTVIRRGQAAADEAERAQRERDTQTIVGALAQTGNAISELDKRLDTIESRLGN